MPSPSCPVHTTTRPKSYIAVDMPEKKLRQAPARSSSGTPSRIIRTERLFRHGSPALKAAFDQGTISLYRCGEISRLPIDEQELAIIQWANRSLVRSRGQMVAAEAIREELTRESSTGSKIDFNRVLSAIRAAIRDKLGRLTRETDPPE
jgi:hypothetical protein